MKYVIFGYGRFGRLARDRLRVMDGESTLVIVDRDPARVAEGPAPGVTLINQDAVSFLLASEGIEPEDVVLPMVPSHLAASFIVASIAGCTEIPLPEQLGSMLPNPFFVNSSNLCASKADFMCPDDCPEGDLCTVTGLPREPLYEEIESLDIALFTVLVQRSFQILPGVGGYRLADLLALKAKIRTGRYLVATSCKCHAVVTALRVP